MVDQCFECEYECKKCDNLKPDEKCPRDIIYAYKQNKLVFTNEQYEQLNDKVIALTKELKTLKGE